MTSSEFAKPLRDAIQDGTFPDSTDLLTAQTKTEQIPLILNEISRTRDDLRDALRETSSKQAEDVDAWIAQAKKVQSDIAQCKTEAQRIVQEHERAEGLRSKVRDADQKRYLLASEVQFTKDLSHEIEKIIEVTKLLRAVEDEVAAKRSTIAAEKLEDVTASIGGLTSPRAVRLFQQMHHDLRHRSRQILKQEVDTKISVQRDAAHTSIEFANIGTGKWDFRDAYQIITVQGSETLPWSDILRGLEKLNELESTYAIVAEKLESAVLPYVGQTQRYKLRSFKAAATNATWNLGTESASAIDLLESIDKFFHFLHSNLPHELQQPVMGQLLPRICSRVISDHLNPAIPLEINDLHQLKSLKERVSNLVATLKEFGWMFYGVLEEWPDHASRRWLMKRKARSLQATRDMLSLTSNTRRQVERIETQMVSHPIQNKEEKDEGFGAWEDEPPTSTLR